ncbi:hypothetical protein AAVH_29654, partial [Aphelenchoides avenae]
DLIRPLVRQEAPTCTAKPASMKTCKCKNIIGLPTYPNPRCCAPGEANRARCYDGAALIAVKFVLPGFECWNPAFPQPMQRWVRSLNFQSLSLSLQRLRLNSRSLRQHLQNLRLNRRSLRLDFRRPGVHVQSRCLSSRSLRLNFRALRLDVRSLAVHRQNLSLDSRSLSLNSQSRSLDIRSLNLKSRSLSPNSLSLKSLSLNSLSLKIESLSLKIRSLNSLSLKTQSLSLSLKIRSLSLNSQSLSLKYQRQRLNHQALTLLTRLMETGDVLPQAQARLKLRSLHLHLPNRRTTAPS